MTARGMTRNARGLRRKKGDGMSDLCKNCGKEIRQCNGHKCFYHIETNNHYCQKYNEFGGYTSLAEPEEGKK